MARRETVLVLGAGASKPYGLPTGQELIDSICRRFEERHRVMASKTPLDALLAVNATEFVRRLRLADPNSIDVFLQHNPDLQDTGKLAIAYEILRQEEEGTFFNPDPSKREDHWYKHLWNYLASDGVDSFGRQPLTIVTFNYDRSLEYYLFTTLKNMFNLDDTDAADALGRLRIFHIHGQLGRLPWQPGTSPQVRYGLQPDQWAPESVVAASRGIRIISEDVDRSPELSMARHYLTDAEVIGFLGFGYHPLNLRRLLPQGSWPRLSVLTGSCFGSTNADIAELAHRIKDLLTGTSGSLDDSRSNQHMYLFTLGAPRRAVRLHFSGQKNLPFIRESSCLLRG